MKRSKYIIRRDSIVTGSLIDLTTHAWLDEDGNQIPWVSGSLDISPKQGSVIYNVNTSSIAEGYYKYSGSSWVHISSSANIYSDMVLPVHLTATTDDLGSMVEFDGDVTGVAITIRGRGTNGSN